MLVAHASRSSRERERRHVTHHGRAETVLHVQTGTLGTCARRLPFGGKAAVASTVLGVMTATRGGGRTRPRKRNTPRADLMGRAYRAGEGKSERVGGSGWAATARAVRSALLRDQTSLYPCATPHSIFAPPSASHGAGGSATRGACAVLSSAAQREYAPPRHQTRTFAPLRTCAKRRSGGRQGLYGRRTALSTPVPRQQREEETERHLGGQGVDGRSAADGRRRRRKRELTGGSASAVRLRRAWWQPRVPQPQRAARGSVGAFKPWPSPAPDDPRIRVGGAEAPRDRPLPVPRTSVGSPRATNPPLFFAGEGCAFFRAGLASVRTRPS